jgi:arginyl-tRNA synthetase
LIVEQLLSRRFADAFEAVAGRPVDPVVRRSQHADFQVDGALPLARQLGRPPRDIAAEVLAKVDIADLVADASVSGPGFINLVVRGEALGELLGAMNADPRLGVATVAQPQRVLVDYSAPNVAKEMHVGHLRSTIIGDAAARVLSFLGHDVLRANHIGDWGTPFGMLIEHLVEIGEAEAAHELAVGDLTAFYQAARVKFDNDPAFKERARQRVVALQSGDPTTRRLWQLLVTESERYFMAVYDQLGVTLTPRDFYGESFYNDRLASVVEELAAKGLLRESDGALCCFPAGFVGRDGEPMAMIVRKADGGYNYAATDLAAIRYRLTDLAATRLLYVVGSPQKQHLEMVYAVAREAGWLAPGLTATHVSFGNVLGGDGRMLKTRAGDTVKLAELLAEAVRRARVLQSPEVDAATAATVARQVGIGAIKYADLATDRIKDYVFDWDRMLALNGDTAVYLQYMNARTHSIFAKGGAVPDRALVPVVVEAAERALALQLLGFPAAVYSVAQTVQPHRLAGYLFELATAFSVFFEKCPVLKAPDPPTVASRLVLCDLTGRVLVQGLNLLGIEAPSRM